MPFLHLGFKHCIWACVCVCVFVFETVFTQRNLQLMTLYLPHSLPSLAPALYLMQAAILKRRSDSWDELSVRHQNNKADLKDSEELESLLDDVLYEDVLKRGRGSAAEKEELVRTRQANKLETTTGTQQARERMQQEKDEWLQQQTKTEKRLLQLEKSAERQREFMERERQWLDEQAEMKKRRRTLA